ncbi:MAG: DUF1553 domain-containing protein [Planctomycetes bacterium]|nr:DUF1553 domain-containing protein [Planctomycetota bacterium]
MRLKLADGSVQKLHPDATTAEFEAAFSADGRFYAYVQSRGNLNLKLVIRDTKADKDAVYDPGNGFAGMHRPSFTPDGGRVFFHFPTASGTQIFSVNNQGQDRKELSGPGMNSWPAVSPDGKQIAFSSIRDGDFEIYVMNVDGSNVRRLTKSPGIDTRPAWSPDGKRIAFTSNRDNNFEIYVIDTDGANVRRVTSHPERDDYAAWHPDGRRLVMVSERNGKHDLYLVDVPESTPERAFHFENDITPLLNRYGCNSSGCHGNAEGQNGFKLSVFGFDPAADYAALVKEARGRRVLLTSPDASLLLAKASGAVPHGGGVRIQKGTTDFETIRGWIAAGAPVGDPNAPRVTAIRVEPAERLLAPRAEQQLRVVAKWSDGREADVTHHARFQSNNDGLAMVNAAGLMSAGELPGEAAIMASYMGEVAVFRAIIPRQEKIANYPKMPEHNFIDAHVHAKLRKLNIIPSDLCDDADFLRRVYLDVIGTLPTPAEAKRFLADKRADRRVKLVDELLERPEYADYWALKWADLLRVDRQVLGHKRAYGYYRWIHESLAVNKPFDKFARELLTAEGPLDQVGPANFFKVVGNPGEAASSLSQVFLGVRIACAQCHHHPYDRWSQTDYFGMLAFFAPVATRTAGKVEAVLAQGNPQTKHPRTGETVQAHALGVAMTDQSPDGDRRVVLADWLTKPDNPWFARNLANRMWAHFLGRGLVEPVDDVRATNPPTNPELLDALAKHLVDQKFDVKQLIRAITASRTYQLSTRPNKTNDKDEQNYSRALFRRLDAEVLLDMVSQTTGVPEKFHALPSGYRAIQLWDSKVNHYFLKVFGRPVRASACECERSQSPSVSQVLHLMNSPEIQAKLSHEGGAIAKLAKTMKDDASLVDELFWTFYCRPPTEREREIAITHLRREGADRRQGAEDLAWSMLNTLEFIFNH